MKQISSNIRISYSPYRAQFRETRHDEIKKSTASKEQLKVVSFKINPSVLIVVLMVLSVSLGFFQVMTSNKIATKGYDLKRQEVFRQQLQGQSNINNQYLADVKSMVNMLKNPKISNMINPAKVEFVQVTTPEIAKAY